MEYGALPLSLSGRNPMLTLVRDQNYDQLTIETDLDRYHWSRRPWQGARIHCQLGVSNTFTDAS